MKKVKQFFKKVWYYLQLMDAVWSVPLFFLIFWFVGLILQAIFGYDTGFYDPSFIQPIFLAGAIVIAANAFALGGLYFTFRGLYRYLYGRKTKLPGGKETIVNESKFDWKNLKTWQKFLVAFFAYFYFISAVLLVWSKLA